MAAQPKMHLVVDNAEEINTEYRLARESADSAVKHAIKCGELLTGQKARLKHGEFGAWVKKNCEFSQDTAQVYMRLAQKPSTLGISIRALLTDQRAEKKPSEPKTRSSTKQATKITGTVKKAPAQIVAPIEKRCTPDSIMENMRGRGERRYSVDQTIDDLLDSAEIKCQFMWRYAEPHIDAIDATRAAEFKKRADQCKEHFTRLAKRLEVQP